MSVNIDFLKRAYFYFDKPVPFKVEKGEIKISPVSLVDSELFLGCIDILTIDKNIIPDPKIIQMNYLQFICQVQFLKESNVAKFVTIMEICLGLKNLAIKWEDQSSPIIVDKTQNIEINHEQFEDIKTIILNQNFAHYDDDYINPELKKAMQEVDELKNKNIDPPTTERKMAIITSHTGMSKKEQQEMTYRSHVLLFEEVCGEVEYNAYKPIAVYGGKGEEIQWIYRKKKNRLDGYVTSVDSYAENMGGSQSIRQVQVENGVSETYMKQFNNFNQNN